MNFKEYLNEKNELQDVIKVIKSEINNSTKSPEYMKIMKNNKFYDGIVYAIDMEGLKHIKDIEKSALKFYNDVQKNK